MDDEFWGNLIKNVLDTFVFPELNRRQGEGTLPEHFELYAAQIVMEPGKPNTIRVNEEVKLTVGLSPDSEIEHATEFPLLDFATLAPDVVDVDLPDDDNPNAAHITLVRNGPGWFATFDLRYNAARISEHILAAEEFISAARDDLNAGRLRSLCSNLFTAVELLAKARLLLHPDERLLTTKKHSFIISSYHREVHLGNADPRFAQVLKRLEGLRNSARYPSGTFSITEEEAQSMLEIADEMLRDLISRAPPRAVRMRNSDA